MKIYGRELLSMDTNSIVKNFSSFIVNCLNDAMKQHYEEEIASAVENQRKKDILRSIAAFLELKAPETEIMRLLSKFYCVDSIAEAAELITSVRVDNQVCALTDYLDKLGMSHVEVVTYLKNHHVKAQIHEDPKLQNMAIDRLKAYFDKH